jgi:CheY-like chemotaxis protein
MVLDLKLPGTSGFALLEQLKKRDELRYLPVIIYTGKDLTRRDETRLRKYADTIIVKDARSPSGCSTRRRCSCTGSSPSCHPRAGG